MRFEYVPNMLELSQVWLHLLQEPKNEPRPDWHRIPSRKLSHARSPFPPILQLSVSSVPVTSDPRAQMCSDVPRCAPMCPDVLRCAPMCSEASPVFRPLLECSRCDRTSRDFQGLPGTSSPPLMPREEGDADHRSRTSSGDGQGRWKGDPPRCHQRRWHRQPCRHLRCCKHGRSRRKHKHPGPGPRRCQTLQKPATQG